MSERCMVLLDREYVSELMQECNWCVSAFV